MKTFCFTVDDNILFFKDIMEKGYKSIFENPYLAMYKRLHEKFNLKIQLNLFYRTEGFDLSMMSEKYLPEWKENCDWLKLSFHSDLNNVSPYEFSGYDEVFGDCEKVNREICRFASPSALAKTTTVHYCLTTKDGVEALRDNKVLGLLGLFGTDEKPSTSYSIDMENAAKIRDGNIVAIDCISYAAIDVVLNCFSKEENLSKISAILGREGIRVMIHEQYFYPDYKAYQPDFEEKLEAAFSLLTSSGYESRFFEELI